MTEITLEPGEGVGVGTYLQVVPLHVLLIDHTGAPFSVAKSETAGVMPVATGNLPRFVRPYILPTILAESPY